MPVDKNKAKPCIMYISRNSALLDEKVSEVKDRLKGKINTDTDLKVYGEADEIEESELANFLGMPSFFSKSKVLILKGVDRYPAKLLKVLARYIEDLCPGIFLVLTSSKERLNPRFLKAVRSAGTIKSLKVPSPADARRWLRDRAGSDGLDFSPEGMETFLENVDYRLDTLKHEYEKLYLYAGGSAQSIGPKEVNRLIPRVHNLRVFDLVDYVGARDKAKALKALRSVLGQSWALIGAVTLLHRCFKAMLYFKYHLDKEGSDYIRKNSKAPPYMVEKIIKKYKGFAAGYSHEEVLETISILNEYDIRFRDAYRPENLMAGLISEIIGP